LVATRAVYCRHEFDTIRYDTIFLFPISNISDLFNM
jgi:hypothetical protein